MCVYFDMKKNSRVAVYLFTKYILVSFFLFLGARIISTAFLGDGYMDLLAAFIFSLVMAFAINEAYKKGSR